MSNVITLYDIPSTIPCCTWGPNTWKTRYCLNYKGLPHKTVWVEYPDIEKVCKELGVEPTATKPDGVTPLYTVPFIHDPKTNMMISDSVRIAKYLDATYPDTPRLIPEGTDDEQTEFRTKVMEQFNYGGLRNNIIPTAHSKLNPRSQEYFRRTRELSFGKKIEEITPTGKEHEESWQRLEVGMGKIGELMTKDGKETPFAFGDTITFADFALGGNLHWVVSLWGEDSWQWKDIGKRWQGGRWGAFMKRLDKYAEIM